MGSMIAAEYLQDLGNEPGQVNSGCLGIPVILRVIMEHFSTTELIQLSLVNKFWNYEARSLMRNRGNLNAIINKNHSCQDLRAFASDLRLMKKMKKVVPFSGMTISVGGTRCCNKDYCEQSPNRELEPIYEEILNGLTWKDFSLKHLVGWEEHKSCPGFILQKKILRKLDWVLEEFSVQLEWNEAKAFQQEFLDGCYFSRLKTFEVFNEEEPFEAEWSDLIKTVVSNAPSLQVLYTKECVNLEANLLEGSSAVHMAGSAYSPSLNEVPESVASVIKMEEMDLAEFSPDFSLERFNRATSMLLQSSRRVMSANNIDVIFLAPLMNYGICMDSVTNFELDLLPIHSQETHPHFWRIAKSFDFTRMYPNLKTVTILLKQHRSIPDEFYQMTEQVSAALETPLPDRTANIKNMLLDLKPSHRVLRGSSSSFHLIAEMFPHVQKLSIRTDEVPSVDTPDIWADLQEVAVLLAWSLGDLTNLDSVFCGIFPEEVAHLREQDEDFLRRVNIVPVMPSISYWKELRTFSMEYEKHEDPYRGPTDDPTCMFSKVAALIVFQRCPNLTVTLTLDDERLAEALGHLKPYATVNFTLADD